jgi:hypothetical protein
MSGTRAMVGDTVGNSTSLDLIGKQSSIKIRKEQALEYVVL